MKRGVFQRWRRRLALALLAVVLWLGFVAGWIVSGFAAGFGNESWHLWLNSPTTALTFLGVYALHNTQHRHEKAHGDARPQQRLRMRPEPPFGSGLPILGCWI